MEANVETMQTLIFLPWPPSANTYWRHKASKGRAITYISARGREFRDVVVQLMQDYRHEVSFGTNPVKLTISFTPPTKRAWDLDNRIKPLLDALQAAEVFADDVQVMEIVAHKRPPDGSLGGARVLVETYTGSIDNEA